MIYVNLLQPKYVLRWARLIRGGQKLVAMIPLYSRHGFVTHEDEYGKWRASERRQIMVFREVDGTEEKSGVNND